MSQTPAAPGKFGSGRFHRPNPYGGSSVTGVMSMPFGSQNNNNSAALNSARKSPHSRQGSSADPGSDSETLTTVSSDNFSARLAEITKGGPPAFDYENEIKKEEVIKEANKELFEFPKDDIKEVELPREFRTELDPEIKDWQHARDKEKLLPHVKDCVEFYLTKWRGYTRTCADLGLKARSESDSNLTSLLYEDSIEESQQESSTGASASGGPSSSGLGASSGRDVVRTDLLESYKPKTTDGLNEKNRLLGRHELYQLNPAADAAVVTERVPPFKPKPVRRFLIEPKELKFELGNIEPYFCTMALYDISKKVRISENYYFELNGAEVTDMLGEHRIKTKPCKRALFSVSSPSPDIFLVVRIEKVLHGDYDESVESYVKFDNVKDKDREKIERDVKERCARLGQWRQPFCVGILPLFNAEDRSMSVITSGSKDHPHQITMKNIYRYRGDVGDLAFFEQMPEKGSSSSKKMKPLNGYMTLEIKELAQSDVAANTNAKPANMQEVLVSPCSLPVHPDVKVPSSEYIQEVQEFPQTLTAYPNLEYVNNLYLYPEMVNLTKTNGQKSARNIAVSVQFLETDDVTSKLRALWNKNSADPEMSDHVFTAVQYHNKAPQFYDEIKIKLPLHLTPRHNLLFTFYHVPCQLKKPSEPTIVGYAFIPIMVKGRIMEKEIQIPIASELPNKFLSKEASEAIKASLIDSKKITFKFRLRLVSTVHASDKHVNQFFVDNKKHKLDRTALATSLSQLTKAKPRVVIQFMPVLFTQLLQLIAQGSDLSREALHVLINLIASMHNESLDSKAFLEKYVEHVFVDPKKSETNSSALNDENGWVYYELLKQWLAVVKEKTAALPQGVIAASASMTVQSSDKNSTPASVSELEKYHKYSWFLFKIIYKSMCDRLAALHLLQDQSTRQKRFGAECERAVHSLCVLLAYQIQTQLKKTLSVFKDLNRSLAHYLTDMLAVMDRGVVLDVIQHVIKELSPSTTEPQLQLLDVKLEHIKILVLHEHWIELNLPRHHALTVTNLPKLLELYAQRHVLAGVVLRAVFELSINHDKPLRLKALAVLHQLFMRHDHDHRYNKRGVKQRIAELYFPFVLHVIDNLAFYREADFDEQRSAFLLWCYIVKNCSAHLMRDWWKIDTVTRLVGFLTALSFAARVFEHVGREAYLEKMNRESESKSSVMAMFEEKYQDQPNESDSRNKSLRERRIEARSRGNTVGGGTAPSQNPTPGHTPQPSSSGVSVSSSQSGSIKDPKRWRASYASEVDKRFDYNSERESHLSHEVSMILLDALECFVAAKESELVESHQPNLLLDQVFKVLKTSLKMKQSVTYLTHAYATLRTFIYKFPKALFTLNTQYCAKLCNLILAHCNYNNNAVRSEASAIIYLFMKKNFEATKRKNFTRIKVATTIALSKLVGEGEVSDPAYLRRALDVLPEYVRADLKGSDAELENQAIQLVQRLKTILEDSVKSIRHAKNKDNEMLADLYHHIAQSYNNAPDLRVTWLKSLASLHEKNKAWAEAGIAVVHIAALIAEFLNLAEPSPGLPVGCAAFEHVSHSALEEVLESSGDLLGGVTDDEATTELQIFTEDGLVKVMCQAIDYLRQAELYEACNELYKLLLPIFEKNRDYVKLSAAHLDLKEIFDKIILSMQNESRFLGSYYRVAFFGNLFEELSGQEFIYKEPKLTRLGEISDRLVNLYQKKFGEGVKVQLLTTSADVDVSKLDLDKQCYLQITSVDPYFEPWELKDRVTHYDRSYNITSFIFETPFTKDGKQQSGDLSKQYKRKTILQVETAFPYMKTRLKITKKHSVELAPIENALETVEKRIQKLQNELRNPNAKTLMGVLQGTVSPQVHAGSTEVAKAFLSESSKGQYDSEQVESIRRALQEFLEVCADALNRSSQLINPDQIPFQKELEEGFKAMKAVMETYLTAK